MRGRRPPMKAFSTGSFRPLSWVSRGGYWSFCSALGGGGVPKYVSDRSITRFDFPADDGDRVALLFLAFVAVRIEIIEAALDVRKGAVAMVEDQHRVVLLGDGNLPLTVDVARRREAGARAQPQSPPASEPGLRGCFRPAFPRSGAETCIAAALCPAARRTHRLGQAFRRGCVGQPGTRRLTTY